MELTHTALQAAFTRLRDDEVDEIDLANHYFTAVWDAPGAEMDRTAEPIAGVVPVSPDQMARRLETIETFNAGPFGRDWSTVHVMELTDGRICAFGVRSECGDGCCDDGVWHIVADRDALPDFTTSY